MSPIKGLSDRRRLPRVGKIHLGIMAENKNKVKYPKATDYFVFPKEHPQYEELVATFKEEPKELNILIPVEDEDKFASQYYRCYSKTRGLICKGDGETCMRLIDKQTGALADRDSKEVAMEDMACQGTECPDYIDLKCKELMCLQFLLPEISGMGVWQIDTSSKNSIININSTVEYLRSIYGRVAMIPLILSLEPREVVSPSDGKKKTVHILNLRSPEKLLDLAQRARQTTAMLTTGAEEEITEAEVIDAESVVMPVPDDERPELVTHDWEGPAGDPIPEEDKIPPERVQEQAEEDIANLWPTDEADKLTPQEAETRMSPAEIAQATDQEIPETAPDFYNWLINTGKSHTKTWFHKNFSYTEEDMKDPEKILNAYHEVKEQL